MTYVRKFSRWIKRLNLFKVINERTEDDIKQQKIITRVFLILLTGIVISITYISAISRNKNIFIGSGQSSSVARNFCGQFRSQSILRSGQL